MKGKYKDENTLQVAIEKVQIRRKIKFGLLFKSNIYIKRKNI